jgi:hypothetical protein
LPLLGLGRNSKESPVVYRKEGGMMMGIIINWAGKKHGR